MGDKMEVYKNNDELWEKIGLHSGIWSVGEEMPKINFNFYVDGLTDSNVYLSNKGIEEQLKISQEINPDRKTFHYFYYVKVPNKE